VNVERREIGERIVRLCLRVLRIARCWRRVGTVGPLSAHEQCGARQKRGPVRVAVETRAFSHLP